LLVAFWPLATLFKNSEVVLTSKIQAIIFCIESCRI